MQTFIRWLIVGVLLTVIFVISVVVIREAKKTPVENHYAEVQIQKAVPTATMYVVQVEPAKIKPWNTVPISGKTILITICGGGFILLFMGAYLLGKNPL